MMHRLCACVALILPTAATAIDWTPSAELGLVATSGNSDNLNVNGKLAASGEGERWLHEYGVLALRAESDDEVTASRYEVGGRTGYKFSERRYAFGSLRYENDDFSPFEYQAVLSAGYGVFAIKEESTRLVFEIGPGVRRAERSDTGETESDAVLRGSADYKHRFGASTELFAKALVEGASDNTFAQGDLGIAVAINGSLALKAALQVRHNTDVAPGTDKTDTLTTVNLVWSPGKS